jgi:hypothetical protein
MSRLTIYDRDPAVQEQDAYNEGWNYAASKWTKKNPVEPKTKYTGLLHSRFLSGFRDSIDNILLNTKPL